MNGIKILLIAGVIFIAVYFFQRFRNSILDLVVLLVLISGAVVFIIFPDLTNRIAHFLGVGRGADLVFYVSILIFWIVILKLFSRIRKLEQMVTSVIRKDAIDKADKDRNPN